MRSIVKIAVSVMCFIVVMIMSFISGMHLSPKYVHTCPEGQVMVNKECFTPGVYYYDSGNRR